MRFIAVLLLSMLIPNIAPWLSLSNWSPISKAEILAWRFKISSYQYEGFQILNNPWKRIHHIVCDKICLVIDKFLIPLVIKFRKCLPAIVQKFDIFIKANDLIMIFYRITCGLICYSVIIHFSFWCNSSNTFDNPEMINNNICHSLLGCFLGWRVVANEISDTWSSHNPGMACFIHYNATIIYVINCLRDSHGKSGLRFLSWAEQRALIGWSLAQPNRKNIPMHLLAWNVNDIKIKNLW